jgi:putative DNA primase/helicase
MTIDLKSAEISAPNREHYMTKATAVAPGGECPTWLTFLDRVTNGDRALVEYLQRVCGYCLTGSTLEHVLFFLHGTGANGKSVFVNTIAGMLGDYATTAPMDTFMASNNERHTTELAMLRGARLVVATETEEGRRWSEAKLKALTGGDTITARFMRQDFFEFKPKFKLMVAGNHKPSLRSVDEAIRRRMHLVPFTVTIPSDERDHRLSEKLELEWPGILQWAIDGCVEWQQIGLKPPEAVCQATEEYLDAEDSFAQWLDDCCQQTDMAHETTATLFASWKAWAERAGEFVGTQKRFAQNLLDRNFEAKREGGTGRKGFTGIQLLRTDYTDDPRYP